MPRDDSGYHRTRAATAQTAAAAGADYAAVLVAFYRGLAAAGLPDGLAWSLTETMAATLLATRERELIDASRAEDLRVWNPQ